MRLRELLKKYPSIFIARIFLIAGGFYPGETPLEIKINNICLVYTISTFLISFYVEGLEAYFCCKDFDEAVRIAVNIHTIMISLFKVSVMWFNRKALSRIIVFTRENIWYQNYSEEDMKHVKKFERISFGFIFGYAIFHHTSVGLYIWSIHLENRGKNVTERILPFPMYFPIHIDTWKSPIFEILYNLQIITLYQIGVGYVCFDYFVCVANFQISAQYEILKTKLTKVFLTDVNKDNNECQAVETMNCYEKLRQCVRHHQAIIMYIKNMGKVFYIFMLGQVVMLAVNMCLIGYHVLIVPVAIGLRAAFTSYYLGTFFQLYLFTNGCDMLIRENHQLSETAFHAAWYNSNLRVQTLKIRKILRIIMMRCESPPSLSAAGFFVISLESLNTVISTSASYFTLLRQQRMKKEELALLASTANENS